MLAEKTRGNLSLEEQRLIENSLTELRFRYRAAVEEATISKTQAKATSEPSTGETKPADDEARLNERAGDSHYGARIGHQLRRADHRLLLRGVRVDRPARQAAAAVHSDPLRRQDVLIDTTPDFRQQALRAQIERIDAILYTHSHADHILGLDDVRPFNYRQRQAIPIYAMQETLAAIRRVFRYAFAEGRRNLPCPAGSTRLESARRSTCSA